MGWQGLSDGWMDALGAVYVDKGEWWEVGQVGYSMVGWVDGKVVWIY